MSNYQSENEDDFEWDPKMTTEEINQMNKEFGPRNVYSDYGINEDMSDRDVMIFLSEDYLNFSREECEEIFESNKNLGICSSIPCRMYTCRCQNTWRNEKFYDGTYNQDLDWFVGYCENCNDKISSKYHAVRSTGCKNNGGWVGCFCSVDCAEENLKGKISDVRDAIMCVKKHYQYLNIPEHRKSKLDG